MLWAACCHVCWGIYCQLCSRGRKRYMPLNPVDSHTNPSMVRVYLKQSKTDPFRPGVYIFLGHTDAALSPVVAILVYYAIVSPLIIFKAGSPLTRDRLVAAVQSALSYPGVDTAHYPGHNFRVGTGTITGRASLSESVISI